jgi:hypothetical protein
MWRRAHFSLFLALSAQVVTHHVLVFLQCVHAAWFNLSCFVCRHSFALFTCVLAAAVPGRAAGVTGVMLLLWHFRYSKAQ